MKITVAVPTIAGREKYLAASLMTCITQDVEDLEILVSDNSLNQSARAVVDKFQDKRIKYISPPEYLPMPKHWDFVLSEISGDVFTIIGDDDGLMPNCISRVKEILNENGLKIIHHSLANYYWPDYLEDDLRSKIVFFHTANKKINVESGIETFKKFCHGQMRYVDGPMAYHNFLPTNMVRSIAKDGVFFRRAAPDVYSSVAISAVCDNYLSVGEFLTLAGQGAKSNGASVVLGKKEGLKFLSEMQVNFKQRFNTKRILQLMLLDSIYEVIECYGYSEMTHEINIINHLHKAIGEVKRVPGLENKAYDLFEILCAAYQNEVLIPFLERIVSNILMRFCVFRRKAVEKNILMPPSMIFCDATVSDVYQASLFLDSYLRKQNNGNVAVLHY